MQHIHIPVLLTETLRFLNLKPGDTVIDCTLGEGGHALPMLERIAPDNEGQHAGRLIAFELDAESIERAKHRLRRYAGHFTVLHENFSHLESAAAPHLDGKPVNGILFDLGLSRFEVKEGTHGFSFERDAPLDMRLDRSLTVTAADVVNQWPMDKLIWVFQEYGQEKFSYPLAAHICRVRRQQKFTTTRQLSEAVLLVIRNTLHSRKEIPWVGGLHPATRVFQALRIAVNDELGNLERALPQALSLLAPGGRLAVIAFHSAEDRIIKNFFRSESRAAHATLLTKKPVVPTDEERKTNPSSRSAKLRAIQKEL